MNRSNRHFWRATRVALAAIAGGLALLSAAMVRAATITVNTLADPAGPADTCSLRQAITNANDHDQSGSADCIAGTGNDTIKFTTAGAIELSYQLPAIAGTLTIRGPGVTVQGFSPLQIMLVNSGATLNLQSLTLTNGNGRAILNFGTLTVSYSAFIGDQANGPASFGGAIFNSAQGMLTVNNSTFIANRVTTGGYSFGFGGAIANFGILTVSNSTFTGNQVSRVPGASSPIVGGAIYNSGMLMVSKSTFRANQVTGGSTFGAANGGAIYNHGTLRVSNSTFTGNKTTGGNIEGRVAGSAIFAGGRGGDTVTVSNSTFSGNQSTTFRGSGGGAIFNLGPASMTVKGTILAANIGTNCFSSAITDGGYNISDDNSCPFSGIGSHNNTNPMLDPMGLQNNGGPTRTIALLTGSPAIDAIPFASCTDLKMPPNHLTLDQRGKPRPDPEDGASGPCDIGAYEFQASAARMACTGAHPSTPTLWPPDSKFVSETILGLTAVAITGIRQDEPVATDGTCPDASGVGSAIAQLRAERDNSHDGRDYHIQFTAINAKSTVCSGEVTVCVPHDQAHRTCGDQGALYDSTERRH